MEIEITFIDGQCMTFNLNDARLVLTDTMFFVYLENDDEPDVCVSSSYLLRIECNEEV